MELLQHPQQLEDLKKDPKLVEPMVEELLRYHTSSALATRRVADQDVEVLGQVPLFLSSVVASVHVTSPCTWLLFTKDIVAVMACCDLHV